MSEACCRRLRPKVTEPMNPDVAWAVWSRERAQRIEVVLDSLLAAPTRLSGRLLDAMRHSSLGGGKRVRALLAYAGGELSGAEVAHVDAAAAAVEFVHAYSLIHDDLPCMDDDSLRRGKPTCHVAFGEATALLAGDALQSLAFEVLAGARMRALPEQIRLLAVATGARGMAGGQAIDLAHVDSAMTLPELETMHRLKTGALIDAATRLGVACGHALDADEDAALARYTGAIGLAFQVVDDALDVEGTTASLGKTAGKDTAANKPTYVTLLGLGTTKARAQELRDEAHAALAGFGTAARRLRELADWIVLRQQ